MESRFQHLSFEWQVVADSVYRKAIEEFPPDTGAFAPHLVDCIESAISDLGSGPVIGHFNVLVYRHVRCCIRAGSCNCGDC